MAVYIDNARIKYGRMVMCHMIADTLEELHKMADKIGVKRKWFQGAPHFPHYDICLSMKELAIKHGAKEVSRRELWAVMKQYLKKEKDNG